jgi:FkbM family methyltransferase
METVMSFLFNLNKAINSDAFRNSRGSWRIRRIFQKYVFGERYFKAPYLGHMIFVCPTHSMGKRIFAGEIYELAINKTIQTFSSQGFSFIDIGANIGLHTLAAAFSRKNDSQVLISFEPNYDIFLVLKKNCMINHLDFVTCRQEGLGEFDAYLPLNISVTNNKGRNSFLQLDNTTSGHPVKVTTLDNLFLADANMNSRNVLIKIDTEGYELPIIKGGMKWLSQVENLAIICEISPAIMEKNNMAVNDLFAVIKECGLKNFRKFSDEDTAADLYYDEDNQTNSLFYKGAMTEKVIPILDSINLLRSENKPI